MSNVVLVLGKGGVGKTTISILISLCLSNVGSTLLFSLDPAKHLMKYLGIEKAMKYFRISENLTAYQLDIEEALGKVLDHYATLVRDLMPSLSVLNIDDVANVIRYSPGLEEEVFMRELLNMYMLKDFKYVVVDTPPTGITLRTLVMPKLYSLWIDKLINIRERVVALRYTIARTLGKEFKISDPALEKLYELRENYGRLWNYLRGSSSSYVLVANPEPMPLTEVVDITNFLKRNLGTTPKLLVMNKYVKENVDYEVMRVFNELQFNKILIPKVEPPPSKLDDFRNMFNLIDSELIIRLLLGSNTS